MAITYDRIATTTLTSNTTVSFTSIPQTYTDLIVVCNFGATTASQDFLLRFNGDNSSSLYSVSRIYASSTSVVADGSSGNSAIIVDSVGVQTSIQALNILHIMDYRGNKAKASLNQVANYNKAYELSLGIWRNTAAINSIQLSMTSGSLLTDSTFTIYGILRA